MATPKGSFCDIIELAMEDNTKLILRETTVADDYNAAISGDFFTPLSQTWSYGLWQRISHRNLKNFIIQDDSEILGGFQLLQYPLPLKLSYLYIPHGPVLKKELSQAQENNLLGLLQKLTRESHAIFLRIDCWPKKLKTLPNKIWREAPDYTYHGAFFQPRFEWMLDLRQKKETLLAKMHPHCRYNIKLAEKKGVQIKKIVGTDLVNYFPIFYALMVETSRRDGFGLHPKDYYKSLFETGQNNIELFFAQYDEQYLAVDLIYYEGNVANWIFGGSSNSYRNLKPTFLLQWQSILSAQEKGYKYYTFGGAFNPEYPTLYTSYKGITDYKRNYGGLYLNYNAAYIFSPRPVLNYFYNLRRLLKNHF